MVPYKIQTIIRLLGKFNLQPQILNTQYMRNPDMVYVLKMEYVSKINIFGLKMMVKSGLEKIFLKFLPYFINVPKITNSVIKITIFLD